jgi:hypothetical protein
VRSARGRTRRLSLPLASSADRPAIPIHVVAPDGLSGWLESQDDSARAWVSTMGFEAGIGEILCLPDTEGSLRADLFGWGTAEARTRQRYHLAAAAGSLPAGRYRLVAEGVELDAELETIGWLLAGYRFDRYRAGPGARADLICPEGVDAGRVETIAAAAALTQDLINTPAVCRLSQETLSSRGRAAGCPAGPENPGDAAPQDRRERGPGWIGRRQHRSQKQGKGLRLRRPQRLVRRHV